MTERLYRGDTVSIIGRRWRDTFGNTYHTVEVEWFALAGRVYFKTEPEYGYGSQWEYTALRELVDRGHIEGPTDYVLRRELDEKRGIDSIRRVFDVNRKKDL